MSEVRVIVVSGPAGSGKTTFGTRLASAIGFGLLDFDDVTGPLTEAALSLVGAQPDVLDGNSLGARLRAARYGCLLKTAAANLAVGCRVVVVAPFTRERASVSAWRKVLDTIEARVPLLGKEAVRLVYLECPSNLLLERLIMRGAARDRVKINQPAMVRADAVDGKPVVPHIRVDAAASLDDQVRTALVELGFTCESEPAASRRGHRC